MGRDEVLRALQGVFEDVFEDDDVRVADATTAADVEGWDSLSHIRLMLAIEQKFRVRFSAAQVAGLANVGALADVIVAKTAG